MIYSFLYNKERVLIEGFQLAQLAISSKLGLKENIVTGDFRLVDGKLIPNFVIDKEKVPLSKLDDLESIVKGAWGKVLPLLVDRLKGFDSYEKDTN